MVKDPRAFGENTIVSWPDAFGAVADEMGGRPAIVSPGGTLTYFELNQQASSVANGLLNSGFLQGPEPLVALVLRRCAAVVPAMIGTWLAGAAYLPVDIELGTQRLEHLVRTARPSAIVTHDDMVDSLSQFGVPTVTLANMLAVRSGEAPSRAGPDGLAYAIYTSGSTGAPKGVAIEHRNLLAYCKGFADIVGSHLSLEWAVMSSFATDLAYSALFPPLLAGGTIHVLPKQVAMDPSELDAYLSTHRIGAMKITPSHLSALLTYPGECLPAELIVCGGEQLSWSLVERVWSRQPNCRVLNHYGPTETTIGVCVHDCRVRSSAGTAVPIGRPMSHALTYVIGDDDERIVGPGVGELWIGGESVGRGYLGASDTGGGVFGSDPFTAGHRGAIYRTGDRVEVLADLSLRFVGRVDGQLKVRGFRVDVGEVEAVMRSCPGVREAVAVPQRDGEGLVSGLICYFVPDGAVMEEQEFRRRLTALVPDYMLPQEFVAISEVPLTASGKADREALIKSYAGRRRPAESRRSRRTEALSLLEVVLVAWEDTLGNEVDPDSDFFEIGGDSLTAVRLTARLQDALAVTIPVAYVYVNPTPRLLAAALSGLSGGW